MDAKQIIGMLRASSAATEPTDLNRIEQALEELEDRAARAEAQRGGWKEIGEVLIRAAFGFQMRGFSDTPPVELLESIQPERVAPTRSAGTAADVAWDAAAKTRADEAEAEAARVVEALRDGLIGRVWHVGGHKGYGTCDYPLCAFRGKGVPLTNVEVIGAKPENPNERAKSTTLKVCHHPNGGDDKQECVRWANYIAARARTGRIRIG